MIIDTIVVGDFQVNCLVIHGTDNRVLVVDPGAEPDLIAEHLETKGTTVDAYFLTHGHVDHVSALAPIRERWPAPVVLHAADAEWAFTDANCMLPFYGPPPAPGPIEQQVSGGERLTHAGLTYRILSTPGHTAGCVCFYFEQEDILITGDTLFAGSVGRTDLPGGDSRVLTASLRELATLPDTVEVYPGHGPSTRMAAEKQSNFFLQF
jgi:glyoxylase-like metal-dependent hydrolase (beta-lactamase superfamily II)